MMSGRTPVIRIQAIPEKPGRFIASFHAEFLDSTYALTFGETVTGAVALHRFALMIENQYGRQAKIQIADELLPFHSEAVTDILVGLGITDTEGSRVSIGGSPPFPPCCPSGTSCSREAGTCKGSRFELIRVREYTGRYATRSTDGSFICWPFPMRICAM